MNGRLARQYLLTLAGIATVAGSVFLVLRALQSAPRPEPTAASTDLSPTAVRLLAVPVGVLRACRQADAGASHPVQCPVRLPRRQEPCLIDGASVPAGGAGCRAAPRALVMKTGSKVHGLEIGYSAPYEDQAELNRPSRFLHFVLLGGRASTDPENVGVSLGTRRLGGHTGRLYRGRPGGLHHGHVVFVWSEDGTTYAASLHAWDSTTGTIALLDRLVASLAPIGSLG